MYPPTTESQRTGWALSEVGGWLAGVNRVAHARSARVPRSHPEADGLPVFAAKPRGIGHISYVWAALLKTTPRSPIRCDSDGTSRDTLRGSSRRTTA